MKPLSLLTVLSLSAFFFLLSVALQSCCPSCHDGATTGAGGASTTSSSSTSSSSWELPVGPGWVSCDDGFDRDGSTTECPVGGGANGIGGPGCFQAMPDFPPPGAPYPGGYPCADDGVHFGCACGWGWPPDAVLPQQGVTCSADKPIVWCTGCGELLPGPSGCTPAPGFSPGPDPALPGWVYCCPLVDAGAPPPVPPPVPNA